jgi:hypothetical protein
VGCPATRKCLLICNDVTCLGSHLCVSEGTFTVQSTGIRPKVVVTGGLGLWSVMPSTRLPTGMADKTGLTAGFVHTLE